ncbi:MAG: 3-deoxy-7-phosphoheptulonate synthase, partial [Micrococcales bacterium]|nr:3-deoxy-7-phosphoheptulonate synthase [Micrococcales bacterium]
MMSEPDPRLLQALDAWQHQQVDFQPPWPSTHDLAAARTRLATLPPLVFAGEADALRAQLALAGAGEAFVLQGGDCAESFAEATADTIRNKIKLLLQMAVVLTYGASMPVVKIGRMAGQYAKPRSSQTETRDGVTLPSFYGDSVNSHVFDAASRTPDPQRLLDGYHTAASTLNLIRAFTTGGFASLLRVHEWNKGFTQNPAYARYEEIAAEIDRAIRFMAACGVDVESLRTVDLYASHEALLLDYERPLTRIDSRTGLAYDCSAHLLWIGERTRDPDGAHVEYFAQVRNPVGVKLGPSATGDDALRLVDR